MQIKHVLVPVDQSELAEHAIEYAVALVQQQGSLTLLNVIEKNMLETRVPRPDGEGLEAGFAMLVGTMMTTETAEADHAWENANHYLGRTAARLESLGVKVNQKIAEGQPAERILEIARSLNVDAIVMTTHGRTGLRRLLMGSVAQKVITEAVCPVFLVPQRALNRG